MDDSISFEDWKEVAEGLESALKELETNWFQKAALLKTHLVSPIHDAAAKGNVGRLKGIIFGLYFFADSKKISGDVES
jgi:hypothetical protein